MFVTGCASPHWERCRSRLETILRSPASPPAPRRTERGGAPHDRPPRACPKGPTGSDFLPHRRFDGAANFSHAAGSKEPPLSANPAGLSLSDALGLGRLAIDAADGLAALVEHLHTSILETPGIAPLGQGVSGA